MRALLCPRPHELTLVERPKPDVAAAFRAGPPAARRRVRRRPAHFRGHAALFRLSPGDRPRALRRDRGGRRGRPLPTRPARRDHSLSALRPLRRVPARQDQLLPDCQRLNVLGVHSDGGMADWLCVPDDNLIDASGVGLDEAAMAEFLAIGAHAVRRGEIAAGQRVLIVGAGPIGIACATFASSRGDDARHATGSAGLLPRGDRRRSRRDRRTGCSRPARRAHLGRLLRFACSIARAPPRR